jgi:hypothetical protein|nr:MAG TPA: hypothetical protein [Caudoviricetes sp.]
MVYVQTTKDVSCTIEGDQIELNKELECYIVHHGSDLTGAFDVGSVQFIYKTQRRTGDKQNDIR